MDFVYLFGCHIRPMQFQFCFLPGFHFLNIRQISIEAIQQIFNECEFATAYCQHFGSINIAFYGKFLNASSRSGRT